MLLVVQWQQGMRAEVIMRKDPGRVNSMTRLTDAGKEVERGEKATCVPLLFSHGRKKDPERSQPAHPILARKSDEFREDTGPYLTISDLSVSALARSRQTL